MQGKRRTRLLSDRLQGDVNFLPNQAFAFLPESTATTALYVVLRTYVDRNIHTLRRHGRIYRCIREVVAGHNFIDVYYACKEKGECENTVYSPLV